jgi:anti-sigma factor RsiW
MQPPDDSTLMAYVDGELDRPAAAEIERALAADQSLAKRVRGLNDLTAALRAAFNAPIREPVPARLLAAVNAPVRRKPRVNWLKGLAVAASLVFAVAGVLVLYASAGFELPYTIVATQQNNWLNSVANYHTAYVRAAGREDRPLVDVGGDDMDYLESWFGKRLTRNMHLPRMEHAGYRLEGGRVIFVESQPAAQFFYKVAGKNEIVSVTIAQTQRKDAGWTAAKRGGVDVIYWRKAGYAYVFAGAMDKDKLHAVVSSLPDDIEKI